MKEMIDVVSMISSKVIINVPYLNFRRVWRKKGAVIKIDRDILEQAFYEKGVEYLFTAGILYMENKDLKEQLGLTDDTGDIVKPYKEFDMKKMLITDTMVDFREKLNEMTKKQAEELATVYIDILCTNYEKGQAITEKTAIQVFRQVAETKKEMAAAKEEEKK